MIEMIVVIVITGILGGIVAVFIKAPIQGYLDSSRRAEMTDIADIALRRIGRDLRLALPNSLNLSTTTCPSGTGSCEFLEFIPTTGGGRYRNSASASAVTGEIVDPLDFGVVDTSFEVLATSSAMPTVSAGDQIVVYSMGIASAVAYSGNTLASDIRRTVTSVAGNIISLSSTAPLPFSSCITDPASGNVVGGCRFHVVQTPVSYVCDKTAGKLTRYWGYPIQATQPFTLASLQAVNAGAVLATNVSVCHFDYQTSVAQSFGLLTLRLTISELNTNTGQQENVSLYSATHVSNVP
jgi:MSHA biogenesis protein MshO